MGSGSPSLVFPTTPRRDTLLRVPSLPNETITQIIKEVGASGKSRWDRCCNRSTWVACCLVARAFVGPAREMLYREVIISEAEHKRELSFRATIQANSHLASLVRRVEIDARQEPQDQHDDVSPVLMHFLQHDLGNLSKLTQLSIAIPPSLIIAYAIFDALVVSCPPLHRLEVEGGFDIETWNPLHKFLKAQASVEELDIAVTEHYQQFQPWDWTARGRLDLPLADPPTFKLISLQLLCSEVHQPTLEYLTFHSKKSLTTLDVNVDAIPRGSLSLSHLASLRTVSVTSDSTLEGFSDLEIADLPIHHLKLDFPCPSFATDLPTLPPTLQSLDLHDLLPAPTFLFVLTTNLLEYLTRFTFAPYAYESWPQDRRPAARTTWTPAEQTQVARACAERGFRLVTPDPSGAPKRYVPDSDDAPKFRHQRMLGSRNGYARRSVPTWIEADDLRREVFVSNRIAIDPSQWFRFSL